MPYYDEDEDGQGEGLEPTPSNLAHWVQERYLGDERFESVDIAEPGPLDGEAARVMLACGADTYFFVSVLEDDAMVRVGLATENKELSEEIEQAAEDEGGSLTEFFEQAVGSGDELEHEVQHFHDDVYYFCSEIPYSTEEELGSSTLRDALIFYMDGYIAAFHEMAQGEE